MKNKLVITIILLLCLTGCWGTMRENIYDQYFVHIISLDERCSLPYTPECVMEYQKLENWKDSELENISRRQQAAGAAAQVIGAGAQGFGSGMQNSTRQNTNCTSIVTGNIVQTNCH
jgi:hypothetical protein